MNSQVENKYRPSFGFLQKSHFDKATTDDDQEVRDSLGCCAAEVAELQFVSGRIDQNIFQLQISMDDGRTRAVESGDGVDNLEIKNNLFNSSGWPLSHPQDAVKVKLDEDALG